ncbi:MAG: DUF2156 domain-containing protein [Ruminococcaceae bacterium]|nr:DUF2156 domain-containing protein [Oscillospiraceae bacterium]
MIDFHIPTLEDKEWVDSVLVGSRHRSCVYTFAQMYLWSVHYGTQIARYKNCLLSKSGLGRPCYIYPAGEYDIAEIVDVLEKDAAERGVEFGFCVAEDWQADELDSAFPGRFARESSPDDSDYVYSAEDLINLSGRKYHGKRNHISKFTREHPEWSYEPLSDANAADCLEAGMIWYEGLEEMSDSLAHEREIIQRAITRRDILGLKGGLIRVDGKVVAFTLGERLNGDTFVVHFEKALPGFEGAYPVINNSFAAHELSGYRYINREEDLGIEGLRKAKLSYYPAIMVEKFTLSER